MWQRIQTVFLGIAILSLLASLVFPIWLTDISGEKHVLTSFYYLKGQTYQYSPYSLTAILAIASITLSIIGITKYKNRMTQLKVGLLNSLFLVGVIFSSFYFSNQLMKSLNAGSGQYGLGMWIPAIAVLCNLLANRFIRKDEKLVKDSNRLR
jgi:Domain of unknown function (DUF4293)